MMKELGYITAWLLLMLAALYFFVVKPMAEIDWREAIVETGQELRKLGKEIMEE